jgi:hypothetical protein
VANVAPTGLIGLKVMDKMEIGLLSNQDTATILLETCMQYQSLFLDLRFGFIIKALGHPL